MNSRAFSRLSWRMDDEVTELIDDARRIRQALGGWNHVVHLGLARTGGVEEGCMDATNACLCADVKVVGTLTGAPTIG